MKPDLTKWNLSELLDLFKRITLLVASPSFKSTWQAAGVVGVGGGGLVVGVGKGVAVGVASVGVAAAVVVVVVVIVFGAAAPMKNKARHNDRKTLPS